MKSLQIIMGSLILLSLLPTNLLAQYYYSHGQQLPLNIDSTKISLKFNSFIGQDDQAIIIDSIGRVVTILPEYRIVDNFVVCSLATSVGFDEFLDSVRAIDDVYLVEPFYFTDFGSAFLAGDRICVSFALSTSLSDIDSINGLFASAIGYEMEGMPNVFVIRNTDSTGYTILELANLFYELSETEYAHPIFGVSFEQHSYNLYDFYNDYQPHLKKVIGEFNFASVWDFAGLTDTIVVAVLDDGIDNDVPGHFAHEDLPASRVLPGRNFLWAADVSSAPCKCKMDSSLRPL